MFVAGFVACCLAGFALLLSPWATPAVLRFSRSLVDASGALIHLFGGHARVEGAVLRDPSSGFAIEMKDGCNGVNVTILLCSAVLAFPTSRTQKLKGLLIGTLAIQCINIVRFISLFYLGQASRAWFDFSHHYLWESLIMVDSMVIFGLWVKMVFRGIKGPDVSG
jgi:exosortase H (IPTLxxWG-CTERM-specific)